MLCERNMFLFVFFLDINLCFYVLDYFLANYKPTVSKRVTNHKTFEPLPL